MLGLKKFLLSGAVFVALAGPSFAADIVEAPAYEPPVEPVVYAEPQADFGGWYIRGDVDYHWTKWRGADYITYGAGAVAPGTNDFKRGEIDGAWSLGGGVGYQVNRYFRTDLTADYFFKAKFRGSTCDGACSSGDETEFSSWLLLANAYAELGTWHRITPYIGAGIGGAHVKWDDLRNTIGGVTTVHKGVEGWRFAWALMAGASYCLTPDLSLDLGYRYSRIGGGRMFEYAPQAGPGFHKDLNVHEVRAGLRYQFGGPVKSGCGDEVVAYEPTPEPVYK